MPKLVAALILAVGTGSLWGLVIGQCAFPAVLPCHHCTVEGISDEGEYLPQGSLLLWTCDSGYVMTGDGDTVVWVCGQNDTWLRPDPICTEISCPDPSIPAKGSISGGRQHWYPKGTNVSYECDSGYSFSIGSSANITCGADGEWTFNGAVCKIECPAYYEEHNNVCFNEFTSDWVDWGRARETCDKSGEILALAKDSGTHTHLESMVSSGNYWIGAQEGRDWKWASDESYIQRLFWNEGEPNGQNERCVELRNSTEGRFYWNDKDCYHKHGFICQEDGPCTGDINEGDWFNKTFNDKCYSFIGGNYTWHESRDACTSINGSLVEILDLSTQEFLSSIASLWQSMYSSEFWIGAFEDTNDDGRSWFWVDNTRVITSQWDDREPSNDHEKCIEMRQDKRFQWNDEPCDHVRGHFCQRGLVACGDPGAPGHGVRAPDDTSSFLDGATVNFRCDPGYQLNGSASITCLTNGIWDGARPFCEAVNCSGDPQNVDDANFTVTSRKFRGMTTYSCLEGFLPTAPPVSYCQADASWSKPNFSCSAIPTLPSSTTPLLTNGPKTSRTLSRTDVLSTTVEQETTTLSQSLPLTSVIAGTTMAILFLIFALLAAVFVVLKRRNRQVVKSDTIQYLEERDGHHHTSENIYNLSNYDVISDLTAGETNPAPNSSHGAELSGHDNFGGNEDVMVDNELYIATVEHTC
ncbi:CUB and sushi domain-containing protein 3-like [Diadema antillarum]|uniref:CUB and sushi domain-containing protein 3-like n=1 Tax=Diadema antillarum TaxID=105358 RepID=UPI003A87F7E1